MSASPVASALMLAPPPCLSTYSTSLKPSAFSRSSAMYCGDRQMLGILTSRIRFVSGGGSAPSPPPVREHRRSPRAWHLEGGHAASCLQLLLQLVEEAEVGSLGDDLLRARLDHPGFVH